MAIPLQEQGKLPKKEDVSIMQKGQIEGNKLNNYIQQLAKM
jgi:hypothetical protein